MILKVTKNNTVVVTAGMPLLKVKDKGKGKGGPYSEGAYRRGTHLPFIGR